MINFKYTINPDVPSFYNFNITIDTGTTITDVNPGLVDREHLLEILEDVKEQVERQITRLERRVVL